MIKTLHSIFTTGLVVALLVGTGKITGQGNVVKGLINQNLSSTVIFEALSNGEDNFIYAIGYDNQSTLHVLTKFDDNLQPVWQKYIYDSTPVTFTNYVKLIYSNGAIYALGICYESRYKYMLQKFDTGGTLLWSKKIVPNDPTLYDTPGISVNSNGDIIVSSSTYSQIEIFSINGNGNTNWIKAFTTDSTEIDSFGQKNPNFDITLTESDDIIGSCKTESDMSFYCIRSSGSVKWARRMVELDEFYTHVKSIHMINPNRFLFCGLRTGWTLSNNYLGFYGIMDSTGNIIDFKMSDDLVCMYKTLELSNGHCLVYGQGTNNYLHLLEVDANGNMIQSYKTNLFYNGKNIIEKNGTLFLIDQHKIIKLVTLTPVDCFSLQSTPVNFGGVDFGSTLTSDYFANQSGGVVAVDPDIQLLNSEYAPFWNCTMTLESVDEPISGQIDVYPNPVNGNGILQIKTEESGMLQYQILDMSGRIVDQKQVGNQTIQLEGIPAGMYTVQILMKGNILHQQKMVVTN